MCFGERRALSAAYTKVFEEDACCMCTKGIEGVGVIFTFPAACRSNLEDSIEDRSTRVLQNSTHSQRLVL